MTNDYNAKAERAAAGEDLCWCMAPAEEWTEFGPLWCHAHTPRCQSGAHFFGNCKCVGIGELLRRQRAEQGKTV